jgi:hypothetical protein
MFMATTIINFTPTQHDIEALTVCEAIVEEVVLSK